MSSRRCAAVLARSMQSVAVFAQPRFCVVDRMVGRCEEARVAEFVVAFGAERAPRNEALFREVNEQARSLSGRQQSAPAEELLIICECSDDGCTERVSLAACRLRGSPRQPAPLRCHARARQRLRTRRRTRRRLRDRGERRPSGSRRRTDRPAHVGRSHPDPPDSLPREPKTASEVAASAFAVSRPNSPKDRVLSGRAYDRRE